MVSDNSERSAFFEVYREYFIGAYSDIVVFTSEKPLMVLSEFESAFTHLMKYEMGQEPDANLKKAKGHIFRAALDCYKMLWKETHGIVSEIDLYRGAYEGKESELLEKLQKRDELATAARYAEHNNVGSEDIKVLKLWRDAAGISWSIYKSVNKTAMKKLKRKAKHEGWFRSYGFPAIMCVAGIIGGYVLGKFF